MMRDELSDETLMAYADGELDEPVARRVEMALAADPSVARRIAGFHRSRRLARAAFAAAGTPEVPDALRAAVEREIRAAEAGPAGVVVPFERRGAPPAAASRIPGARAMAAIAAALALVVGAVAGYQASGLRTSGEDGGMMAALTSPAAGAAIGRIAAGESAAVPGGTLRVIQSFRTAAGTLCREVDLAGRDAASAVACREDGGWRIRFAAAAPGPGPAGGYQPAEGEGLADGWLSAAGAGPMLDPDAEAEALAATR